MPLPITTLYAGLLGLIPTVLAVNVTLTRRRTQVPLGAGDSPLMLRMMRVHGNCAE
jgi:uncharacterized membrane protein YecN with MAPEG domain